MLFTLLLLGGCLLLLIVGAWCVSEGGEILGSKFDATIVGALIIAWLNTLPETIFFVTALENGEPNFAMGAISGSVIVVSTVAVGFCVYIGASMRPSNTVHLLPGVRQQALALGGSLVLMVSLLMVGFQYIAGIAGIAMYCAFVLWTLLRKGKGGNTAEDAHVYEEAATRSDVKSVLPMDRVTPISEGKPDGKAAETGNEADGEADSKKDNGDEEDDRPLWKGIAFLLAGGLLIFAFSDPFISCVVQIGQAMGLGPLALAFFFAPVASEAPEIIEAITLSRKGKTQNINIAFSNLVSGTLSKTTLLTGILCLYSVSRGYAWISPAYTINVILIIISSLSAAVLGLQSEVSAARGRGLIGVFVACAAVQFVVAYYFGQGAVLTSSS